MAVVASGQIDAAIPTEPPPIPAENPEPLKQRIHAHPPRNRWKRLLYNLTGGKRDDLDPEEIARLEEAERRTALEETLRAESHLFERRIQKRLNGLGLCYRYRQSEKTFPWQDVKSVEFDQVIFTPDAHFFRIDTGRLPFGVSITQLTAAEVVTDLSIACQRRVSSHFDERVGAFYVVERATGVLGIPNHVKYADMLAAMPKSADGLTIPLGMGINNRPIYSSLNRMYSMLIGGTIGSGKSNILNVILCTLIRRNPPDRLKMILVDLKGGLEFSFYEGIPHLLNFEYAYHDKDGAEHTFECDGIVYDRRDVPLALEWLLQEGERRIKRLKRAGYKDIGRYNQYHRVKGHLPHLIFVIDEWADVKLEPKTGKSSEDLLTNIAQRFRAVGIHVILCTQVPKTEIVSTRIKGVLPAKVACSCPTIEASKAIIDNGHAKSLTPQGRFIFQWGDEQQVQAPFIPDAVVRSIVDGAITGKFDDLKRGHDVTELEIMTWALNNDSGFLSIRKLYQKFGARGLTQSELLSMLQSWEGNECVVGSSLYRVEPGRGQRARRLIAVDGEPEPEENAGE